MNYPCLDIGKILQLGFSETSNIFLNSKNQYVGKNGYKTLFEELHEWIEYYETDTLRDICLHFTTFTASIIPELPNSLNKYSSGIKNPHKSCRDTFSAALNRYKDEFGNKYWQTAAEYFEKSGELIQSLTNSFADCIIKNNYLTLPSTKDIFEKILTLEEKAFNLFL